MLRPGREAAARATHWGCSWSSLQRSSRFQSLSWSAKLLVSRSPFSSSWRLFPVPVLVIHSLWVVFLPLSEVLLGEDGFCSLLLNWMAG